MSCALTRNAHPSGRDPFSSPVVSKLPNGAGKRLIDTGMLHCEASVAGCSERYHRGKTSHTIHVWWARRPHSAMRALVFASLAKETGAEAAAIMASLAMDPSPEVEEVARRIIARDYPSAPKLLDMFGGGGTIPFESRNLGAETYSIDANQLSVFIQRCNLEYASQVDLKEARGQVAASGKAVLERVKAETDWLYPLRRSSGGKTFGYLWSYQKTCDTCGRRFYLVRRPWLSTRKGRRLSFDKTAGLAGDEIFIRSMPEGSCHPFAWGKGRGKCFCPYCHAPQGHLSVSACRDALLAVIDAGETGKSFRLAPADAMPPIEDIDRAERQVLAELGATLPEGELPAWSGIVNPAIHGVRTHADFLNRRQRLLLLFLIRELSAEYARLQPVDEAKARFVIGALSSLIDQVIDWNCRLSMWIAGNEQVGRAFCGPGVAMLWDYTESDMLLHGPANLWDKLDRIVKGVSTFRSGGGAVTVRHAHAQRLPFADGMFDAIVTDPPYYDNIYYSILADFFYAWKRILLRQVAPDLFAGKQTDAEYELVASARRQGNDGNAHESYCRELKRAFSEAARVIKPDGVFSLVYSHSSVNAWDAVVQAYRSSPFRITSVQPLGIERKGRPRSVLSQAVNTCMAFVARKSAAGRSPITLRELESRILDVANSFGRRLKHQSGWSDADAGLAVLAYGVGLVANAERVAGAASDADALVKVGTAIKNVFPEFSIRERRSL